MRLFLTLRKIDLKLMQSIKLFWSKLRKIDSNEKSAITNTLPVLQGCHPNQVARLFGQNFGCRKLDTNRGMLFLIDHNLAGHAEIVLGNIAIQGWLELLSTCFVTFKEMNLSVILAGANPAICSNTGGVWRQGLSGSWAILPVVCAVILHYYLPRWIYRFAPLFVPVVQKNMAMKACDCWRWGSALLPIEGM